MGKYFRVTNILDQKTSRHYTICNAMRPEIYKAYVDALKNDTDLNLDEVLNNDDQSSCSFVVKNFNTKTGLSRRFFKDDGSQYRVKGPVGVSLLT
jgi:hypothetical protein